MRGSFKTVPHRRVFQAWQSVLDLGLIPRNYLEAVVEIKDLLLSRLAGYFLLSTMHSYTPVLLDGDKKLHVLLNLIQGSKHLLISIM